MNDVDPATISDAERLARAVILFYSAVTWDDPERALWLSLTGESDATTRVLCDLARVVRDKERIEK